MVLLIVIILSFALSCANKDAGKIPITTNSKEARQLFIEGRSYADRLQAQESKTYLEKAVEKDSEFAMGFLYLSFAQSTAREFFEYMDKAKALTEKVSEGEKLWILGFDAGVNGLPMKQREYYQKLVDLYPNDERAHNLLGLNYFGQQEYEAAIAEFRKSIALAPDFSQPYNQMGYAYRFTNQYAEAERAFQKYIELIPNDPNPYDSYAELLLKMGNYSASIENYDKALQHNPNFVNSFLGIATDYNLLGEYEKARATLDKLMENARNNGEKAAACFAMTISFIHEGNFDNALETLNKQLELNRSDNDAAGINGVLVATGNLLLEMGNADEALKKFDEALNSILESKLAPEIKDAAKRGFLNNSVRTALVKKDLPTAKTQAEEFFAAAQQIQDANLIRLAHELKGLVALSEKDFTAAITELDQANKLNPYNLYRLGIAYSGQGDKEKAQEYFRQAANFNSFNDINLAFCRSKALKMLEAMK